MVTFQIPVLTDAYLHSHSSTIYLSFGHAYDVDNLHARLIRGVCDSLYSLSDIERSFAAHTRTIPERTVRRQLSEYMASSTSVLKAYSVSLPERPEIVLVDLFNETPHPFLDEIVHTLNPRRTVLRISWGTCSSKGRKGWHSLSYVSLKKAHPKLSIADFIQISRFVIRALKVDRLVIGSCTNAFLLHGLELPMKTVLACDARACGLATIGEFLATADRRTDPIAMEDLLYAYRGLNTIESVTTVGPWSGTVFAKALFGVISRVPRVLCNTSEGAVTYKGFNKKPAVRVVPFVFPGLGKCTHSARALDIIFVSSKTRFADDQFVCSVIEHVRTSAERARLIFLSTERDTVSELTRDSRGTIIVRELGGRSPLLGARNAIAMISTFANPKVEDLERLASLGIPIVSENAFSGVPDALEGLISHYTLFAQPPKGKDVFERLKALATVPTVKRRAMRIASQYTGYAWAERLEKWYRAG